MSLESKVASIVEYNLRGGVIFAECFGSSRKEKRIVFPPSRQNRKTVRPEKFLKLGIQSYITFIIPDQLELNLFALRAA
jgi:hypothetical protein